MGSAITVDLVSAAGAFAGGAILPGMAMAARALHEFTDLLPLVEVRRAARRRWARRRWGRFVRDSIGARSARCASWSRDWPKSTRPVEIFLTGGAAPEFRGRC